MSVRKESRELTELKSKQSAFISRKKLVESELEIEIEKAGEEGIKSGKVEGAKIAEKQAELKAIGAVLINLDKKIPVTEARVKKAQREHAQKRINELAEENNTLLLMASKRLLNIAKLWKPVEGRFTEAENLRGSNPGPPYPMSLRRESILQIKGMILASVCKAVELNPEIEPLLKEFEKLGLGQRL